MTPNEIRDMIASLNHRFVRTPIVDGDPSILDILKTAPLDEEKILFLIRKARELTDAAEKSAREREERWKELGYKEPSREERNTTLNLNLAQYWMDIGRDGHWQSE